MSYNTQIRTQLAQCQPASLSTAKKEEELITLSEALDKITTESQALRNQLNTPITEGRRQWIDARLTELSEKQRKISEAFRALSAASSPNTQTSHAPSVTFHMGTAASSPVANPKPATQDPRVTQAHTALQKFLNAQQSHLKLNLALDVVNASKHLPPNSELRNLCEQTVIESFAEDLRKIDSSAFTQQLQNLQNDIPTKQPTPIGLKSKRLVQECYSQLPNIPLDKETLELNIFGLKAETPLSKKLAEFNTRLAARREEISKAPQSQQKEAPVQSVRNYPVDQFEQEMSVFSRRIDILRSTPCNTLADYAQLEAFEKALHSDIQNYAKEVASKLPTTGLDLDDTLMMKMPDGQKIETPFSRRLTEVLEEFTSLHRTKHSSKIAEIEGNYQECGTDLFNSLAIIGQHSSWTPQKTGEIHQDAKHLQGPLRHHLVSMITSNPEAYRASIKHPVFPLMLKEGSLRGEPGDIVEKYCSYMSKGGSPGGLPEIQAMSNRLKRPILFIMYVGDTKSTMTIQPTTCENPEPCVLQYKNGCFQALLKIERE